ncbi:hypothetical protein PENSPDRAFT_658426 [Peniophora sp. CONT]|nr:hypothetical protein PENSPDRAFT_658426 [Peniophora sp. CONT]
MSLEREPVDFFSPRTSSMLTLVGPDNDETESDASDLDMISKPINSRASKGRLILKLPARKSKPDTAHDNAPPGDMVDKATSAPRSGFTIKIPGKMKQTNAQDKVPAAPTTRMGPPKLPSSRKNSATPSSVAVSSAGLKQPALGAIGTPTTPTSTSSRSRRKSESVIPGSVLEREQPEGTWRGRMRERSQSTIARGTPQTVVPVVVKPRKSKKYW